MNNATRAAFGVVVFVSLLVAYGALHILARGGF